MMMHPWQVLGRPSQRAPSTLKRQIGGAASPLARFYWPQISLVLDGIPLNLATFRTGPNQYARFVPTMALQALTITEGPASTLYGRGLWAGASSRRVLDSQTGYRSVFSAESADEGLGGALTPTSLLRRTFIVYGRAGQWRHSISGRVGLSGTW